MNDSSTTGSNASKTAPQQFQGPRPIGQIVNNLKATEPLPPSESQSTTSLALMNNPEGKKKLANMLKVCYDGLKVYGKEPEQLDNANKLFNLVLSDYPIEKIVEAMKYYIKHNTEFPAPADIAIIIERGGGKPPFDRSVYVSASKKHPADRSSEEWDYMREYEKFMMTGKY